MQPHASHGCPLNAQRGVCSNNLRNRRDVLELGLLAKLQAAILQPDVVQYTIDRFEAELTKVVEGLRGDRERLQAQKSKLDEELRNLACAIADGHYSPSIMEAISVRENELKTIANRLLEPGHDSVKARLTGIREFVTSRLGNLREVLNRDAITARTELATHVPVIKLQPEGTIYKAIGEWDYLGDARMVQLRPAAPTDSRLPYPPMRSHSPSAR